MSKENNTNNETNKKFVLQEIHGNLFNCDKSYSLAHCVSEDYCMGRGIAVEFKKKFGRVADLKNQRVKTGGCSFLKDSNRNIYYLVTKEKYWKKPTYDSLACSLRDMKKLIIEHNVKNIAMPKIGCGLDRLEWNKVKDLIIEIFGDLSCNIYIYKI